MTNNLIQGEVIDRTQRPMARWRRAVLWMVETPVGRALWGLPVAALVFAPVFWLGAWWGVLIVAVGLAFTFGWNAAVNRIKRGEWVDRL